MNGGMQAGKAATQNQDSSFLAITHKSPFRSRSLASQAEIEHL